jgi:hypothetical protein
MERLGDDAARVLAAAGGSGLSSAVRLARVWPQLVGGPIARAAWPQRLAADGTLHVATTSAVWAFELERLAPQLEARLREQLGADAPAALRFRPGPVPGEPALEPDEDRACTVSVQAADRRLAASLTRSLADAELRSLVRRAAAASLARARSGRGVW